MLRAAIYARVSSLAQRDAHTIENQRRTLRAYVAERGWELVEVYEDDGRSAKAGKLDARDGFARLVRDAEARRFDVLVVVDIDRLTRTDSIEERAQILGPFQRLGIQIVTPSGGALDLRSFLGEFWVTVQALVAAEENRKRAERIKAGKLRAIAEGRKPAGPTPYGLAYDRATATWSIDTERAAILREIFTRTVRGESCQEIAEDLYARQAPSPRGPWSRHKVWQLVRSRHAAGEWTADKRRRLVVKVPAIVDESTWRAAQEQLIAHGKRGLVKTKHVYLLEGLAVCSDCGSPIAIRSATHNSRGYLNPAAYVCRARKYDRIGEKRCGSPVARTADIDAAVWERITEELNSPGLAADLEKRASARDADRRSWERDVETWRRKLEKLDKHEAALLARFRRDQISETALDAELAAVARERTALRGQLQTAEQAAKRQEGEPQEAPGAWLEALRKLARKASSEAQQSIVRALVAKGGAVLAEGRVKLTLRVRAGSRDVADGASPVFSVVASG